MSRRVFAFLALVTLAFAIESENQVALKEHEALGVIRRDYGNYMVFKNDGAFNPTSDPCAPYSLQLVSIHSEAQNNEVYAALRGTFPEVNEAWIGLIYQNNQWVWRDGSPLDYTRWSPGEPNGFAREPNGGMWMQNGLWNDEGNALQVFICMRAPVVRKDIGIYSVFKNPAAFNPTSDPCAPYGLQLVTIHSDNENAAVYNAMRQAFPEVNEVWMGLIYQNNQWLWRDGTPVDYLHWSPGEPNGLTREPNGGLWMQNGLWNDEGNALQAFICQMPSRSGWSQVCFGCEPSIDNYILVGSKSLADCQTLAEQGPYPGILHATDSMLCWMMNAPSWDGKQTGLNIPSRMAYRFNQRIGVVAPPPNRAGWTKACDRCEPVIRQYIQQPDVPLQDCMARAEAGGYAGIVTGPPNTNICFLMDGPAWNGVDRGRNVDVRFAYRLDPAYLAQLRAREAEAARQRLLALQGPAPNREGWAKLCDHCTQNTVGLANAGAKPIQDCLKQAEDGGFGGVVRSHTTDDCFLIDGSWGGQNLQNDGMLLYKYDKSVKAARLAREAEEARKAEEERQRLAREEAARKAAQAEQERQAQIAAEKAAQEAAAKKAAEELLKRQQEDMRSKMGKSELEDLMIHLAERLADEARGLQAKYELARRDCDKTIGEMTARLAELNDNLIPKKKQAIVTEKANIAALKDKIANLLAQIKTLMAQIKELETQTTELKEKERQRHAQKLTEISDVDDVLATLKTLSLNSLDTTTNLGGLSLIQVASHLPSSISSTLNTLSNQEWDATDQESIDRVKKLLGLLLDELFNYQADLKKEDAQEHSEFEVELKKLVDQTKAKRVAMLSKKQDKAQAEADQGASEMRLSQLEIDLATYEDERDLTTRILAQKTKLCADKKNAFETELVRRQKEMASLDTMRETASTVKLAPHVAAKVKDITVGGRAQIVCAMSKFSEPAVISCPPAMTIFRVKFASYGNAGGDCPNYNIAPNCRAGKPADVGAACVGKPTCRVEVPANLNEADSDMSGCVKEEIGWKIAVVCQMDASAALPPLPEPKVPVPQIDVPYKRVPSILGDVFVFNLDHTFIWDEGANLCKKYGLDMVSIHSATANDVVSAAIADSFGNTEECWIGLNQVNNAWVWTDGSVFDYSHWENGEPNNVNMNERHVGMWSNSPHGRRQFWNDEGRGMSCFVCATKPLK